MALPIARTIGARASRHSALASVALSVLVVVATTACPGAQLTTTSSSSTTIPTAIAGAWQSGCLPVSPTDDVVVAVMITYGLTSTLWALDVALFDDVDCALPFGTIHTDGGFFVERPSTSVAGAWDIRLDIRSQTVTPHADAFITFLEANRCGGDYGLDRITDMFDASCPALGLVPVVSCPTAYDIVVVDSDTLRFGQRDPRVPRCTESTRPTSGGPPLTAVR